MLVLKQISPWANLMLHLIIRTKMTDYLVILGSVNTGKMESVTIAAMKMRTEVRQRTIVLVLEE